MIRIEAPKGFTEAYGERSSTRWQWAGGTEQLWLSQPRLKIESGPCESMPWEERPSRPRAQGARRTFFGWEQPR